jgi:flagellar biosynthesis/type III secretory pathway protein FliH
MTFYLLHHDEKRLLAADHPIVKAGEHSAFADAQALLERLRQLHEEQRRAIETAEAEARERGLVEGLHAGKSEFAQAIADLSNRVAHHRERVEREIASLALAALRLMVAAIGDEAMLAGVTRRAVAAVVPGGRILVEASPAMCPAIQRALAPLDEGSRITLQPDPALSDRQCRVTAPDGRIIADLDVQLDAIAQRLEGPRVD